MDTPNIWNQPTFCPRWQKVAKSTAKKGKGQQNVASFPLLELPHPMAEYVGDYYLTYHFLFCWTAYFSWSCFLCEYCEKCLKNTVCLSKTYALGQIRPPEGCGFRIKVFMRRKSKRHPKFKTNSPKVVVFDRGRYVCASDIPTTLIEARSWKRVPRGNPLARFLRLFFAV